jgi:hypothetical protein
VASRKRNAAKGLPLLRYNSVFAVEKGVPLTRRRNQPQVTPPDLPPERAYAALTKQLGSLPKLKGRDYREAGANEDEWTKNLGTDGTFPSFFRPAETGDR